MRGEVWNPVTGCSGKSCPTKDTCWAKDMVNRFPVIHQPIGRKRCEKYGIETPFPFSEPQFHPDRLNKPLHWKKPRRAGVCFMSDWMDEQVPIKWISDIYVVMMECERIGLKHQFFTLTKQSKRLAETIHPRTPLSNLYNGVSITSQADADRMIPDLLRIPGKHWVSIEPFMKGPIDLKLRSDVVMCGNSWSVRRVFIDFIVIGSHNRPKLYPCPHAWMIDVVEQCRAAKVPVWVKQIEIDGKVCTDITKFPKELQVRELP